MAKILIVEDEENLRFSIRQSLLKQGHEVFEAASVSAALTVVREQDLDVVLSDINLGAQNGLELLAKLREDGFDGVIVMMTAFGSVASAVQAIKSGADDYLQKPLSMDEVSITLHRHLEHRRAKSQLRLYERLEQVRHGPQASVNELVGRSQAWQNAVKLAERLSAMPINNRLTGSKVAGSALPTILLLGETGTGKGVLARLIHDRGAQQGSLPAPPFVHVNCSALPPSLVESELFGHEKGAFTDAKGARSGLFELAEGGTIFLDEIGDMPLDLQAKILTVVEDGVYRRVGGTRERHVRARLIAATNQDLESRVKESRFRGDLLYRLNAFTIRIPSLRERGEDAVLLGREMLARFCKEFSRPVLKFTAQAERALSQHHWPGNVRELINLCQRLAMLADGPMVDEAILGLQPGTAPVATPEPNRLEHALSRVQPQGGNGHGNGHGRAHGPVNGQGVSNDVPAAGLGKSNLIFDFDHGLHQAEDVERELIFQALQRTHGNVSKAARLIGMQRSSLRYRLDRFKMQGLVPTNGIDGEGDS